MSGGRKESEWATARPPDPDHAHVPTERDEHANGNAGQPNPLQEHPIAHRTRPSSSRVLVCIFVLAVALSTPKLAGATTQVRIELADGDLCGDRAVVEARVATHGVAITRSAEAAAATVSVAANDGGLSGTLVLSRLGTTTTRVVTAGTCEDVLDALAFTLGLALEGDTAAEPPPLEPAARVAADRPRSAPADARTPELGAGGILGVVSAVSPDVAPAVGAWVMLGTGGARWFSPSAILSFTFVLPVDERAGSNRASAALQAGRLDLCPSRLGSARFGVRPCLRGLIGRSQVRSEGFASARLDERLFSTLGVAARGEARFAPPVFIHLDVAVGLPVERATYFVDSSRVFETPFFALSADLGAGVHFP